MAFENNNVCFFPFVLHYLHTIPNVNGIFDRPTRSRAQPVQGKGGMSDNFNNRRKHNTQKSEPQFEQEKKKKQVNIYSHVAGDIGTIRCGARVSEAFDARKESTCRFPVGLHQMASGGSVSGLGLLARRAAAVRALLLSEAFEVPCGEGLVFLRKNVDD